MSDEHAAIETEEAMAPGSPGADEDEAPPTADQVREAMRVILDPEIGLPIVDLGLVYEIDVADDGDVKVIYTLTSMGCPVGPMIESQVRQIVESLPGVKDVTLEMTFRPPWSMEMMSEDAKAALGYF